MTNAIPPNRESGSDLPDAQAERLARYAAGSMTQGERTQFEREILASEALSEALYADESLRAAVAGMSDDVARARARRSAPGMKRSRASWLRFALPLAAGVAIAVVAPRLFDRFGGDHASSESEHSGRTLRSGKVLESENKISPPVPGPSSVTAPTVKPLFPFGTFTEDPLRFEWTSDPAATAYRIEMTGESGERIFSLETPETTIAFPGRDLASRRGDVIVWRVTPIVPQGTGISSESLRFRIDR